MKSFRKVLFWVHLVIGLAAGVTIAITVITGAAMSFEKQVIAWAEGDLHKVKPPEADAKRLTVEELLRKAREAQPEARPMGVTVSADPTESVVLNLGRTNTVYANPYTGELVAQGAQNARAFFQFMLRWHRWLGVNPVVGGEGNRTATAQGPAQGVAQGEARPGGEGAPAGPQPGGLREIMSTVMGISAAIFLTLSISGLYLWWPRNWKLKTLRTVSVPNVALKGKARDWNWHNAVGLWSAPVIVIMSFTGMVMAFRGFGNFVYGPQAGGPGGAGGATNTPAITAPTPGMRPLGPDALLAAAQKESPNWQTITLRMGNARQRGGGGGGMGGMGGERRGGGERGGERGEVRGEQGGERGERGGQSERPRRENAEISQTGRTESAVNGERGDRPRGAQPVTVMIREAGSKSPVPLQLQLNPYTGEVLKREAFGEQGFRRAMRQLNRTLHTGEAGGIPGQAVALLACLGGMVLVYTGFALAWRRFIGKKPRATAVATTPATASVTTPAVAEQPVTAA